MEPEDAPPSKELVPGSRTQENLDLEEFGRLFPRVPMDSKLKDAIEAVDACSLCPDLDVSYSDDPPYEALKGIRRRHALSSLHWPCKTSSCRVTPSASTQPDRFVFCDRCQHLRFHHFSCCKSLQEGKSNHHPPGLRFRHLSIFIRKFEDIETRSANCAFCRMLLDARRRKSSLGGRLILRFQPGLPFLRFTLESTALLSLRMREKSPGIPKSSIIEDIIIVNQEDPYKESKVGSYSEQPEWGSIKQWLVKCRNKSPSRPFPQLEGLKLIDVNNDSIVIPQRDCEYAALSYVWGPTSGKQVFELKTTNLDRLQEPGSLSTAELPLTVKDSMTVCKKVGIPYLWVDRLCIVQDEDASKLNDIDNMDVIFMAAVVTLVAYTGVDAEHGLPGVSTRYRRSPLLLAAGGMEFWRHLWTPIRQGEDSRWVTRGWTYQEESLSSRLLYFTEDRTIAESNLGEDNGFSERLRGTRFNEDLRNTRGQLKQLPPGSGWDFKQSALALETWSLALPDYLTALHEFSRRNLTHPRDRVRAFSGILHALYGEGHLFGLPFEHFDLAILWELDHSSYRTIPYSPTDQSEDGSNLFPSWSWASVPQSFSGVRLHRRVFGSSDGFGGSLASWAFVSKEGSLQTIFATGFPAIDSSPKALQKISQSASLFAGVLAWTAGCMPTRNACPRPCYLGEGFNNDAVLSWYILMAKTWIQQQPNLDFSFPSYKSFWPSYKDFWLESRGCYPSQQTGSNDEQVHTPDIFPEYLNKFTKQHISLASTLRPGYRLLCYTQLLSLTVIPLSETLVFRDQSSEGSCQLPVEDIYLLTHSSSTKRPVGHIRLTTRTYERLRKQHNQKHETAAAHPRATFLALSVEQIRRHRIPSRFGLQLEDIGVLDKVLGPWDSGVGWGPADDGSWLGQSAALNRVSSAKKVLKRPNDESFIILNVMMVVDGPQDGVVRRGGIGTVMLKRWVMADAKWGVVVLE